MSDIIASNFSIAEYKEDYIYIYIRNREEDRKRGEREAGNPRSIIVSIQGITGLATFFRILRLFTDNLSRNHHQHMFNSISMPAMSNSMWLYHIQRPSNYISGPSPTCNIGYLTVLVTSVSLASRTCYFEPWLER